MAIFVHWVAVLFTLVNTAIEKLAAGVIALEVSDPSHPVFFRLDGQPLVADYRFACLSAVTSNRDLLLALSTEARMALLLASVYSTR